MIIILIFMMFRCSSLPDGTFSTITTPTMPLTSTTCIPPTTILPTTTQQTTPTPTTMLPTTLPSTTLLESTTVGTNTTTNSTITTTISTKTNPIPLQAPKTVFVKDGILVWSEVELAVGYLVLIDGQEISVDHSPLILAQLAVGMHQIQIKALGNSTVSQDSEFSVPIYYEVEAPKPRLLDRPNNVIVTGRPIL